MIWLLLATFCSASIALVFKYSETRGLNRYAVTSVNYLTAVLVSAALAGLTNIEFTAVRSGLAIGIPAGICFFLAFVYYQASVKASGAGLAGMFGKLGILMPMILSMALWREYPTAVQGAGILLAISAIALVNVREKGQNDHFKSALILLFLFGGLAEFSNKLFQRYGASEEKAYFLLIVFSVAFLVSLGAAIRQGKGIQSADVITGILVGVPNLFSSFFLIRALDDLPTAVVFPVYSAGSMVLILVLSAWLFGERLSLKSYGAIVMTMLSLILINLKK